MDWSGRSVNEIPWGTWAGRAIVGTIAGRPRNLSSARPQPNLGAMRLMHVTSHLNRHHDQRVALELLLRLAVAALVAVAIFGLLPVIAEAAT